MSKAVRGYFIIQCAITLKLKIAFQVVELEIVRRRTFIMDKHRIPFQNSHLRLSIQQKMYIYQNSLLCQVSLFRI